MIRLFSAKGKNFWLLMHEGLVGSENFLSPHFTFQCGGSAKNIGWMYKKYFLIKSKVFSSYILERDCIYRMALNIFTVFFFPSLFIFSLSHLLVMWGESLRMYFNVAKEKKVNILNFPGEPWETLNWLWGGWGI